MLEAARATCDFYIEQGTASDGVPYWDTGAPGLTALGDWAGASRRSVQRSRAGRQLRRRDRGAGPDSPRPRAGRARGEDGSRYEQAGPRRARHAARRARTLSVDQRRAPGAAAALDLSPAERLGPRAAGLADPARRVEPVGRLPPARGRAAGPPDRAREPYLDVLRSGRHDDAASGAERLVRADRVRRPRPRSPSSPADTRGIGLGIARALAADGWTLALCGVARAAQTAGAGVARRARGTARGVLDRSRACRLFRPTSAAADRARLAAAIGERYGAVNALVNNAGRAPRVRADILDATEDSFEELMRINLQGPYFLTQALARQMAARKTADPSFAGVDRLRDLGVGGDGVDRARRVLRQQGGPGDGGAPVRGPARAARHPGLRSPSRASSPPT